MQSRGIDRDIRKIGAPVLLIGAIVFALLSIGLNIISPTDTTVYNVVLTVVLVVAGLVALSLIARNESLAVQLFWWAALAVIGGMVAVDDHQHGTLPAILYVPPIAAVAVRVLSGFRAAFRYCAGVFALLVPSGIMYGDLGWAVMIAGIAVLYVTVDWIQQNRRRDRLTPVLDESTGEIHKLRTQAEEYVTERIR